MNGTNKNSNKITDWGRSFTRYLEVAFPQKIARSLEENIDTQTENKVRKYGKSVVLLPLGNNCFCTCGFFFSRFMQGADHDYFFTII
jgi:hypothetical protein